MRFDHNSRTRAFSREERRNEFSAALDQIRSEAVAEDWIGRPNPNRPAAPVSWVFFPVQRWILKSSVPRFHKFLLAAYVLAIVWTSFTHAAEKRLTRDPIPASFVRVKVAYSPHNHLNLRAYVQGASKAAGVNPRVAEWIVSHESRHHPEATGDGGESRGLWQINKAWHPEVSDACAYDVTCSTDWSLERIRAGYVDEWSTWKYCKARFEDCPF